MINLFMIFAAVFASSIHGNAQDNYIAGDVTPKSAMSTDGTVTDEEGSDEADEDIYIDDENDMDDDVNN